MRIPFYARGKQVGILEDDGWYYTVRDSNGYCVKHQGWGVQKEIMNELKKHHSFGICIISKRTGVKYMGLMCDWDRFGVPDTLRAEDGRQVFLHKNHFQAVRPGAQIEVTVQRP